MPLNELAGLFLPVVRPVHMKQRNDQSLAVSQRYSDISIPLDVNRRYYTAPFPRSEQSISLPRKGPALLTRDVRQHTQCAFHPPRLTLQESPFPIPKDRFHTCCDSECDSPSPPICMKLWEMEVSMSGSKASNGFRKTLWESNTRMTKKRGLGGIMAAFVFVDLYCLHHAFAPPSRDLASN